MTSVSESASAVSLPVVAKWLSHSSSREVLIVHATSSAVSGWPSDHLRSGRSVYVYSCPSPSQDSASPGVIEKSSAFLSVSVAYCMFHASNAATV